MRRLASWRSAALVADLPGSQSLAVGLGSWGSAERADAHRCSASRSCGRSVPESPCDGEARVMDAVPAYVGGVKTDPVAAGEY